MTRHPRRLLGAGLAIGLACAAFAPAPAPAQPVSKEQQIVDNAAQTVRKLRADPKIPEFQRMLDQALAVLVFPSVLKASFVIGGEGGSGVLLVRHPDPDTGGSHWSHPAFFTMGAGSIGLQLGVEQQEIVLLVLDYDAVDALISNQLKLGGDVSLAIGEFGTGQGGAMTTNFDADIVSFSSATGVFLGASIEGAIVNRRDDFNYYYYGPGATARSIALRRQYQNPGAEELRRALGETTTWVPAEQVSREAAPAGAPQPPRLDLQQPTTTAASPPAPAPGPPTDGRAPVVPVTTE